MEVRTWGGILEIKAARGIKADGQVCGLKKLVNEEALGTSIGGGE